MHRFAANQDCSSSSLLPWHQNGLRLRDALLLLKVFRAAKMNNDERTPLLDTNMEEEPRERRYLIQRPKALQYFHHGQLKKAAEKERVAGRFELFFDLLCKSSYPFARRC